MENFQALTLTPNLLGHLSLTCQLLFLFTRCLFQALDLGEVTVEQSNHRRKRDTEVQTWIDSRTRTENDISIEERSQ